MSLYSNILSQVLLPAHDVVKRSRYASHRRFLEQSQWWTPEQLGIFQWQQLRPLLEHAFRSVPYYQDKYAAAGIHLEDIRSFEDFSRLPILTRQEVTTRRMEMCSTSYAGKLIPNATGGSSGRPARFYSTDESYDWKMAASQRAYSWSGCGLGERALYLWGAPVGELSRFQSLKARADRFVRRQLMFTTLSQTRELWTRIYRRALRFKPRLIVGYVSSLLEFSRFLESSSLRLPGVKAVIAAAEPLSLNQRLHIGKTLGAPVFETYGSREFMSIAAECEIHRGLHINSENVYVETARPATDGSSELIVTDLHNYGMPFLRYAIGDLGLLDSSFCPCGRGLPLLQSVEGRVLDCLKTKDGRLISCIWFRHILKDIPEVLEYQVQQMSPTHIVISAVLSSPLSEKSRNLLHAEMRKVLGADTNMELRPVDEIPKLPSGKRRVVVGLT